MNTKIFLDQVSKLLKSVIVFCCSSYNNSKTIPLMQQLLGCFFNLVFTEIHYQGSGFVIQGGMYLNIQVVCSFVIKIILMVGDG